MPWEIAERDAHRHKALAYLEGRDEEAELTAEEIIERDTHRAKALAYLEGREKEAEYPTFSYGLLPGIVRALGGDAEKAVKANPAPVPVPVPAPEVTVVKRDEAGKDVGVGLTTKVVVEGRKSTNVQWTVKGMDETQNYDTKPLPEKPTFLAMMKRKMSGGNWEVLQKLKARGSS